MPIINNDRIEELILIIHDRVVSLDKRWWKALGLAVLVSIPLFFISKYSFYAVFTNNYQPPVVFTDRPEASPLQVIDRMIFDLGDNNYAGFVRIRNINLERGVPELSYNVKFKTVGGTLVTEVSGRAFVLPASEKILAFPKFTSSKKPELVEFTFTDPKFLYKPQSANANLEVQRTQFERDSGNLYVNAGVKNLSAFTIKQIYLPILLYDKDNKIVAVNSTVINDVKSSETRTFRFVWPNTVAQAVRAEIQPEINVFDKGIFTTEPGTVNLFNDSNENVVN